MKFNELGLRSKILISVFGPLLVAVVIGLVGIVNINSIVDSNKWVNHTYKAIGDARDLMTHAIDMETGMRGFLLAGKEEFLEPYNNGNEKTVDGIKSLQITVSDNPRQVLRLDEIKSILRSWRRDVTEPNIELRRNIGKSKTMEDLVKLIGQAKGKKYFDEFRVLISEFIGEEEVLLQKRKREDEVTVRNTVSTILICIIASLVIGLLYATFITRDIHRQVGGEPSEIAGIAQKVALGELDFDLKGKNQSGILAALVEMVGVINKIVKDVDDIVYDISSGKLNSRGDEKIYDGRWQELVKGINNIVINVTDHVDQIPMPFVIIDDDYNILFLNKTSSEWLGRSSQQVIGEKCYDNFPNPNCRTDKCSCSLSMSTGMKQAGEVMLSSGKRELLYNSSPVTSLDGKTTGAIMIYIDQTKIKREDWLKTGLNNLNEKMSGDQSLAALSQNILNFIAEYVDAQIGAFYIADEEQNLKLISSYAYKVRSSNHNLFKPGEGLIGQAALERKSIFFSDIPDDHVSMEIISGLGESVPQNIYVLPLVFEEELLGVIAIGLSGDLDENKRELLDRTASNISISLNMASSRVRLKELLEKTQAQAEELQTQQEELEHTNEELEQQAEELKASEESLQTQQEELKAANEELTEKTELLETQKKSIELSNVELEKSKEDMKNKARQLELATKYKTEFLANMSHELRTPLNSLLLLSKNLSKNKLKNLTDKQVQDAGIIFKSGNELLDLINGILDLSKIESGKKTVSPEEVYYSNVVNNIENMFRQMLLEKGLDYNVEVDEKLPETLYTDQQKLEQIIKNLMSNALKFTERGSIKIRFCKPKSDVKLEMSGLAPEKAVAIAISDTGKGIPKEKHLEIFEAFQQADGTIVRKYGGTGLGLTICRELAKLLGGEIQLESSEGKGSVFTFYIAENLPELINEKQIKGPAPSLKEDEQPHETDGDTISYRKESNGSSEYTVSHMPMSIQDDRKRIEKDDKVILIIEDDVSFAKVLSDYCHEKQYKCIHAVDGETGLELSEKITVCAIILDLKLPGINGWGVLKKLKSNIKTRHIPVHIMSVEEKPENILQKGVIGYLNKPVTNDDLNEAFTKINKLVSNGVKKLMIVGDYPDTTKKLSETFGSMGVEIESFNEGIAAFQKIRDDKYDCMIMDLDLADISGLELLKKFDTLETSTLPPIIIHTERDLGDDEFVELNKYASSMITKSELSTDRLIDEVALFLHSIADKIPGSVLKNISSMSDDNLILKGKKIMIVDDDVRNIYSIITTLEDYEMEFVKAANGKKALEGLKHNDDIDLVLMDIMMPEMDGYEAIRRIRKMPEFEKLPVIALTAKGMEKDRQQSFEAGATDYLMKPVDSDKLLSTIRVWLHN